MVCHIPRIPSCCYWFQRFFLLLSSQFHFNSYAFFRLGYTFMRYLVLLDTSLSRLFRVHVRKVGVRTIPGRDGNLGMGFLQLFLRHFMYVVCVLRVEVIDFFIFDYYVLKRRGFNGFSVCTLATITPPTLEDGTPDVRDSTQNA